MSLAFGTVHSPQHHHPQLSPRMTGVGTGGGGGVSPDWLKAWKAWAATRKRGKMAQFIVQKLEDNKQARWLNISAGKFELTEWHSIAEEWFKEKPRSSDQVDAPCMLRKGLPRAFPGLEEVKTESVKEGTQYRSRVFQAPQSLVQEVQLYVNKPGMGGTAGYPTNGSMSPYFNQMVQKDGQGDYMSSGGYVSLNQTQNILGSQPSSHYPETPPLYGSPHASTSPFQHMSPSVKPPIGGNKIMNQGFGPNNFGEMSPGSIVDGGCMKVEERSPYSVQNNSPYSSHSGVDAGSPPMSESTYSNYSDGGGMYNGQQNASPGVIKSEGQVFDGYEHMTDSSPYSVNGGGLSPATAFSHSRLEVPSSADGVLGQAEWSSVGDMTGLTPVSSPHYSPEPTSYQAAVNSNPLDLDLAGSIAPPQPPPMQQHQALLDVKPYPDKSPLEGGGHLALIFGGELPQGPKWLSFISQQRPEYVHQVQAYEENLMALSTIIPKHDIPETMTLQVIVHGQVVAQTNFTYYANAQYNSDMLFHYLVHNFPGYFPEVGMNGGLAGPSGGGGGDVFSGGGYYNNIPSTSFNLLLGSCRLGIEELVYATLQLPSMNSINTEQLRQAQRLCEEHSHSKLAEVMQGLVELSEVTSRGKEEQGDNAEHNPATVASDEGQKILSRLNTAETPESGGMSIISRLVQIHKMDKRSKLEEEREQQVPSSPTILPASPVPEGMDKTTAAQFTGSDGGENVEDSIPRQRRRSSSNRLQRQEKSVREDDDLTPPISQHSRQSIAEKDDHLPPLRPVPPRRVQKRTLIATHSDAADSAVSMSFDREHGDYEQEVARRSSASIALCGLYSLNMSSMDGSAVTIKIEQEAGYTFANSLQYECIYQVTDDYPSHSDATSVIFKAGDKIIQIGDSLVRDKGPDDFAELLQEAVNGTTVRIVPRVSPPPSTVSINSSIGYGSLDTASRSMALKQTDQQVIDSITMKVSNLLSMKGSGFKRTLTLPYIAGEKGFGFKMIGGNAVGLFVSEAKRKELQIGDQILEIAGHSALQMSHYEAADLVAQAKDTLQLKVTQSVAKFKSIRDQFEHESFYVRCHVDHTPSDSKDMTLSKDSLIRVVNCSLYPDSWLAWSVDESTGIDMELRRIPSPAKAYHQFGKHVYQSVEGPSHDVMVS